MGERAARRAMDGSNGSTRLRIALGVGTVFAVIGAALAAWGWRDDGDDLAVIRAELPDHVVADVADQPKASSTVPTTATTEPPSTVPPTTVAPATAAPVVAPTTAPPPPPPPPPPPAGRFTFEPYAGLGAWLDVYDWSLSYTNGNPGAGLADIDRMASLGVRTLYVQASKWDSPTGLLVEPDRLAMIIDRAHAVGMRVVGWYLPTLEDPALDLQRLLAIAALPIEGLGVDIEARNVDDVAERNRRLVELSAQLRAALPGEVLSAIVLPPVVMEDINPNYWPGFPWAQLGPLYDMWQPMSYWTNRTVASGWRDGYAYTAANIDRVRAHTGLPNAIVHSIGGIGDATTPDQIGAMVQASMERGAIGGSIYDYRTTHDALWAPLQHFNG